MSLTNYSIEGLLELWQSAGSWINDDSAVSNFPYIHTQSLIEEEIKSRGPDDMKKFNTLHLKVKGELYFNANDFQES